MGAVIISSAPESLAIAVRARAASWCVPDKQTDLMRRNALTEPSSNHFANGFRFSSNSGEAFDLRQRPIEDGDDSAPLVLPAIAIAQD
jgi:hypothetical protein